MQTLRRHAHRFASSFSAPLLLLLFASSGASGCLRDFELPPPPPTCNCEYGLCEGGVCRELLCETSAQCRFGACVDGGCQATVCAVDGECAVGLCVAARCDATACRVDADCASSNFVCDGATSSAAGTCIVLVEGAPLSGDPNALRMIDNLENAWAYVRARHPAAVLVQVFGAGLRADGTVDVRADYSSRWMYAFREGDGQTAPPRNITITYMLQAGISVGAYDPEAGNVTLDTEIPEFSWRAFLDAVPITTAALAASCNAQVGDAADSILYAQQSAGPQYIWSNWKGQSVIGDPITGASTYVGCP